MEPRALIGLVRPPSLRETLQVVGTAAVIAVICWYFGVDVWHSVLLGCAITVIGLGAMVTMLFPDQATFSWRPGGRSGSTGSRGEVANLSTSLRSGGWGLVGLTAERRLFQLARRRLALEGLNLADPEHRVAIEDRIGRPAYRLLVRRPNRRMRLRTLIACLDALDATDPTHYPPPAAERRRRRPTRPGLRRKP